MLREFYERIAARIFACGGTIEKYSATRSKWTRW